MTAADVVNGLGRLNLALALSVFSVMPLRRFARSSFGPRVAYYLWLLPLFAGAAVLVPARRIVTMGSPTPSWAASAQFHPTFPSSSFGSPTAHVDLYLLVLVIWAAGAFGMVLFMAHLQTKFLRQARAGFGGPSVVGLLRPRIHTPKAFAEQYDDSQQSLILAHEAAHIARQDSRVNALCAAAQCLCWFNPFVHLAARAVRTDQEFACDAAVVERFPSARRAYAELLLKAQLFTALPPLGCNWPPENRHPIVERVAMLRQKPMGRARRTTGAIALSLLGAGVGMSAWAVQPPTVEHSAKASQASAVSPSSSDASLGPAVGQPEPGQKSAKTPLQTPSSDARPLTLAFGHGSPLHAPHEAARAAAPADMQILGPSYKITAEVVTAYDDQDRAQFSGNVDAAFLGKHMLSDHLNLYFAGGSKGGARAPRLPGKALSGAIRSVEANGHVTYISRDETARADRAVYGPAPGTFTLTGNVVIVRGYSETRADKAVVDLQSPRAPPPANINRDGA